MDISKDLPECCKTKQARAAPTAICISVQMLPNRICTKKLQITEKSNIKICRTSQLFKFVWKHTKMCTLPTFHFLQYPSAPSNTHTHTLESWADTLVIRNWIIEMKVGYMSGSSCSNLLYASSIKINVKSYWDCIWGKTEEKRRAHCFLETIISHLLPPLTHGDQFKLFAFLHNSSLVALWDIPTEFYMLLSDVCPHSDGCYKNDVGWLVSGESACRREANTNAMHKRTYHLLRTHVLRPPSINFKSIENNCSQTDPLCAITDWLLPLSMVLNFHTTTEQDLSAMDYGREWKS